MNALDILGPTSQDVIDGFDGIIQSADNVSSDKIQTLIENLERQASAAGLSAEEQKFFNDQIKILNDLLDETKLEEKNKEFEDFFGLFSTIGLTASNIGLFALQLGKMGPTLARLAGVVGRLKPELGIIILLLFGPKLAQELGLIQTAGGDLPDTNLLDDIANKFKGIENIGDPADFFGRLGPPGKGNIQININDATFNSEMDLDQTIDIIQARLLEEEGSASLE